MERALSDLESEVRSLGFDKIKAPTRNALYVYVAPSERASTLETITTKLGAAWDKHPTTMRKYSSLGAATWTQGPYKGMYVAAKPDKSRGLSTDEQETLAGIFIATKQQKKTTKYSFEDLQKFGNKMIVSKFNIDQLYDKAGKSWISSSIVVADTLSRYLNGVYEVHQRSGSKFENRISTAAKKLIKQSGHVMGIDKWNPADIWLVKPEFANTDFSKFDSIIELNTWILDKFEKKQVIAVSLKQVGSRAKVQEFNKGIQETPENFQGFDVGKTGFVGGLAINLHFDSGSMIVRNFGRPESVSGEINGKLAQGGKVGSGPLFNIIRRIDKRFKTPSHQEITNMIDNDIKKVYSYLYAAMETLDPSTARKYTLNEFIDEVEKKTNKMNYIISRWQTSDILMSIRAMNQEQKNDLIQAALSYASSSTEISSVFYKVS